MTCGKLVLLQALLAGAALAQQPFQGGFHPSFQPFQPLPALRGAQPAVQTGFQPFQPIQPIQPIQPLQPLQPLPPLQRAAPAPASGSRTEVFGDGVETFKLVRHNQPAAQALPAQVQPARSLPVALPAPVVPAVQPPVTAGPAPAPARAPAPAPAFSPAPALPRPIEQHDAQTFVRRPAEGAPSQTIPFSKVNPVPARASPQEEQENLRFDQENLRIQQAQQAQVDSLRLQQAQSAEQFDQQNRSILKSQRSRQENLRFQDNLQQHQQQQQHQLQLQQQQQQQQQQLFEQQNTRALQSQQVRQENLRIQDNFQQQQPQQQQVGPQFQAQPEDPASGLFDAVPVNTPAPAARAPTHKVHRGRARHQEEPEQQVGRARQHSRRLPIAAAVAAAVAPVATPAAFAATPIRVADDDARAGSLSEEQEAREQAENAHYTFASAIDDKLTDNAQVRQETRDGLNLAGLYSYSDGFFRRTVHYEADENGYRVTKEEVEPLGDGPQPDPTGTADVRAQISGMDFGYRITADDIREKTKEPVKQAVAAIEPQQHRFAPRGERV